VPGVLQARSWLPRTEGSVRVGFAECDGETRLSTLHQSGAARVRFPKPAPGSNPEAVILNMAGGLTGGDRISLAVTLAADCAATITTAAAEKVYRSLGDATAIAVDLQLGHGAACSWLPQPTIVFNGARLQRRTTVHMAGTARLLAIETMFWGRTAMGEDVHRGAIGDAWRIYRDNHLVFADTMRVTGAVADALKSKATLDDARASALLLYAAPAAEAALDLVRELLAGAPDVTAGASSWNGMLLVRAAAKDGRALQRALVPVMVNLHGNPLPRVWQC
jgi:urease accessory protein